MEGKMRELARDFIVDVRRRLLEGVYEDGYNEAGDRCLGVQLHTALALDNPDPLVNTRSSLQKETKSRHPISDQAPVTTDERKSERPVGPRGLNGPLQIPDLDSYA